MKITKTLASILFLFVLSPASFAADYKLVYYSDIQQPELIDQLPSGLSLGDMYVRNAPVRSSENGPVIGEYFFTSYDYLFRLEEPKISSCLPSRSCTA
jgi:hypothetical protein